MTYYHSKPLIYIKQVGLTKSLGKELADKNGCVDYIRVPALGTNKEFINSLSLLVINRDENKFIGNLYPPKEQCPNKFNKCPCI